MKAFLQGTWFKHPLHPILVHLPTALWPAAFVFDILSILDIGGNGMVRTSFYAIVFGLAAALLAVPTGLADWWDIGRDKPAWMLGVYHMLLNIVVTILAGINLVSRLERLEATSVATVPVLLSLAVTLLLIVSGYLGGRMVYSYGTSVARNSKEKWREYAEAGKANVPARQDKS